VTVELMIATDLVEVRQLAEALGPAESRWSPGTTGADVDTRLEQWRDDVAAGPSVESVVVAMWTPLGAAVPLTTIDDVAWADRVEVALAGWLAAFGAAMRRCADGGRIVAVVERPSPLDSAGRVVESGVADAVFALVRSFARLGGPRGVRVNAASTPLRLVPAVVVAPVPPLPGFPGGLVPELSGAVEMLLGRGVAGVTGTVVHVDGGRSWT
jgi:NAD(P)-dependent dehydrogenase (short-subunit alcohol dehydrogenase family)